MGGNEKSGRWSVVGAAGTSQLHGDLLMLILVRLPVKSILRFKSVCRSWSALFDSPIFIQQHCLVTSSSTKMITLSSLLVHTRSYHFKGHIFSLLIDPLFGNPVLTNLKPPFEGDLDHSEGLGSVEGLVCLDYVRVLGSINGLVCINRSSNATTIVLWNPAIRKHHQIPPPQLLLGSNKYPSLGFSYDQITGTYKVIRILEDLNRPATLARVEIYSTRTNSWRTIKVPCWLARFPRDIIFTRKFANIIAGVPCWLAVNRESTIHHVLFVWFDASTEAFRFHPIPFVNKGEEWDMDLDAIGEHPVVVYYKYETLSEGGGNEYLNVLRLEIWKLNKCKDGGQDSFSIEKIVVEHVAQVSALAGFRRNGEIIAFDQHNNLVIYDHPCAQTKHLPSYGNWGLPHVYDYIESLVWPF